MSLLPLCLSLSLYSIIFLIVYICFNCLLYSLMYFFLLRLSLSLNEVRSCASVYSACIFFYSMYSFRFVSLFRRYELCFSTWVCFLPFYFRHTRIYSKIMNGHDYVYRRYFLSLFCSIRVFRILY